jgi:dual specificity tyrosine-phosphorylation-regulated kinase 2/3/4
MIIGRPIFPGENEHEQLDMLMQVFGPVPESLKAGCTRRKDFFNAEGRFMSGKVQKLRRPGSLTLEAATHISDQLLLDLLKKCFQWKQEDRITAADALNHPWFHTKEVTTGRAPMSTMFPELIR